MPGEGGLSEEREGCSAAEAGNSSSWLAVVAEDVVLLVQKGEDEEAEKMKHTERSVPLGLPPDLAPHCAAARFRSTCVQRDCSTPFHYTPYEGKYPEVPTTPDALHLHKVGGAARAGAGMTIQCTTHYVCEGHA